MTDYDLWLVRESQEVVDDTNDYDEIAKYQEI